MLCRCVSHPQSPVARVLWSVLQYMSTAVVSSTRGRQPSVVSVEGTDSRIRSTVDAPGTQLSGTSGVRRRRPDTPLKSYGGIMMVNE